MKNILAELLFPNSAWSERRLKKALTMLDEYQKRSSNPAVRAVATEIFRAVVTTK